MKHTIAGRVLVITCCCGMGMVCSARAQTPDSSQVKVAPEKNEELKFVAVVSRHGVRSPTGKTEALNRFSRQPWPLWSVPPGDLSEHGAHLMTLFGSYERELFIRQKLLAPSGCEDAKRIQIIADSDQRTRETGKALAAGLAPGCEIAVSALSEGTEDPLFHPLSADLGSPDNLLATASISGRIGGDPQGLVEAYRPQFEALDRVLNDCCPGVACASSETHSPRSIFDIPSSIAPGQGKHLVEIHSPLDTASTMAENFLLEYTEGMPKEKVGWGCVDLQKVRELMQLHTAHEDVSARSSYIARIQASNLLFHLIASMKQATTGTPVPGALSKADDRLLILVGHDTNLANISGALGLSWISDGRRDDTPPGGALVFELWKGLGTEEYSVRAFFIAQTLDQMRSSTPLSLTSPPARVALWVPNCSRADNSCDWAQFQSVIQSAIDPHFAK